MKSLLKTIIICALLAGSLAVNGQFIQGPTTVNLGSTHTYTFTSTYVLLTPSWTILKGSVISQSQNGLVYSVVVNWTASGTGRVSLYEGDGGGHNNLVSQRNITVSTCTALAPTVTGASRCGTGTVVLSAAAGSGGSSIRWYSALTGGSPLATATSYTTPSIAATTTYYVTTYNSSNGCESTPRTSIVATINPVPGQPTPSNGTRCGIGSVSLTATPGANANSIRWYSASTGGTLLNTGTSYATPSISTTTTYYVTSYNTTSTCESAMPRQAITATVTIPPAVPATSGSHRFGVGVLNLNATGAPGGGTYKWYNPSAALLASGATYQTPSISSTVNNYLYVVAVNSNGCESAPTWVNLNIYSLPVISTSNPTVVMGANVTLDAGSGYSSYTWKDINNVVKGSSQTFSTNVTGDYTVTVTLNGATGISNPFRVKAQFENQNVNFIVTEDMLVPVTAAATIENLPANSKSQVVQYFDELGRPLQTVATQSSPAGKDFVQPVVYDAFGREHRKYLPVSTPLKNGLLVSGIIDANGSFAGPALNFYNNGNGDKIADDTSPFAETIFERSQRARPIKQGAVGTAWQPDGTLDLSSVDRTIKFEYGLNTTSDYVLKWTYSVPTATLKMGLVNAGTATSPIYFPANQLFKKVSQDEQHNKIIEFSDKSGRVILKKVQANATTYAQTYYIYDIFGNLVYVLPPEAVARLTTEYFQTGATDSSKDAFLKNWSFRYKYDGLNRLVIKQVPGAEMVYMVYDKMDRLVLTQDGNQRLLNKWMFTKYDVYNRPVISGLYTHGSTLDEAQMDLLISTTNFYEAFDVNSTNHAYTNSVFPTVNLEVLTVMYYDDYLFLPLINNTEFNYKDNEFSGFTSPAKMEYVRGLQTAMKTNVLGTASYLWSVTYYDKNYRALQTVTQNQRPGGFDRSTNNYDFVRLLKTKSKHYNGTTTSEILREFDYDQGSRLTKVWHQFGAEQKVLLVENEYNEVGQLVKKKQHSRNNGTTFAQHTDYRYNIRGWLEKVNDPEAPEANDLFSMQLNYNTPTANGGAAQFNGNISEIRWSSAGMDKQSYGYNYDAMNRLKEANYFNAIKPLENGRYNEKLIGPGNTSGYDLNGNILYLSRNGKRAATPQGTFDDLAYKYVGNQLKIVNDAIADHVNEEGFKELTEKTFNVNNTDAQNEYAYDKNGNMIKDDNKGITAITYNHLNLPQQVNKGATDYVVYTYDATGRKLKQQVFGSTPKTTEYLGEFIYENNVLQYVAHEEGRIVADNSPGAPRPWEYQYHLKDHLGNVRVGFSEKTTTTINSATLENATQTTEQATFRNYGNRSALSLFNKTPGGTYSQVLNGGNNNQIGLAKSFAVNPGDVFDLEVYGKYEQPTATGNNLNTLFSALVSAFTLNPTGGPGLEGQQAHTAFNSLFGGGPAITTGEWEDDNAPKAYLNYILFDQNFALVDMGWDQISYSAKQVGVSPVVAHDLMSLHVKVKQQGYLYIYLSNENPTMSNVYFDDFVIKRSTAVEQVANYYAFGLAQNSNGFERQGGVKNPLLYNGKELQDELNLGWLDYGARMYMPEIGTWGGIDPLAAKFHSSSPYSYAFNSPIVALDPDGREGTIYIQVFLDKKGKPVLDKKFIDAAVKGLNQLFKSKNIDLKVEAHFGNKIMSKNEFYGRSGAHQSDSYSIIGGQSNLTAIAKEANEKGWEQIHGNDDGFNSIQGISSKNDYFSLINADLMTKNVDAIDPESKTVQSEDYLSPTEKIMNIIQHETGHPKFKSYPKMIGVHVPNTIMQKLPMRNSTYDGWMLDRLKSIHGLVDKTKPSSKQ
jgi:RHS repeat-associated protein